MTTTIIKERPILFSAAMVQALLAGTKSQTRRVVKHPITPIDELRDEDEDGPAEYFVDSSGQLRTPARYGSWLVPCPYGQPGDRLWVRETLYWDECGEEWCYQADNDPVMLEEYTAPILLNSAKKSIPSIHMPREASRLLLEIVSERVERLQDISRGDAMEEGCPFPNMAKGDDPCQWYASLWESINGPGSWERNPLVWVVEFRVVSGKEAIGA